MSVLVKNAYLVSPCLEMRNASLELENGLVRKLYPAGEKLPACSEVYDAAGKLVVPGFIDVHCHGGMGYETTSEHPDAVRIIGEAKLREGVTSFCPTTLTLSEEKLAASLRNIEAYRKSPTGSKVLGTHLEGPYINPECAGAQNPAYLRKADIAEVLRLHAISPVALVSYAIEMEGSVEFTRQLQEAGIVCSCGHTNASYAQFREGMKCGLRRLTHFCNQMTKLHHREIGLVGAGLYEDDVTIEMICDKIHLCPDMIKLAFKCKPAENILLISDAMEATGLPDGNYQLGGLAVVVSEGAARLASNGALAGSTLQMNMALKNVLEVTGKALPEVIQTTAWNQALDLKLDKLGKLEPGFIADVTVLADDFSVAAVFVDGVRTV